MHLSLFDNDENTLGNAALYGPSFADVVIDISGSPNSNFVRSSYAGDIQDRLNSRGWIVENVADNSGYLPAVTGFNFRVFAVVGTRYGVGEILNNLRADLSGLFNVTGANVVGAAPAAQSPASIGGALGGAVGGNFATALGISTPIAIVGGGILLLLLLRR